MAALHKQQEWLDNGARMLAERVIQLAFHRVPNDFSGLCEAITDQLALAEERGFTGASTYFRYLNKQHPEQFLRRFVRFVNARQFLKDIGAFKVVGWSEDTLKI